MCYSLDDISTRFRRLSEALILLLRQWHWFGQQGLFFSKICQRNTKLVKFDSKSIYKKINISVLNKTFSKTNEFSWFLPLSDGVQFSAFSTFRGNSGSSGCSGSPGWSGSTISTGCSGSSQSLDSFSLSASCSKEKYLQYKPSFGSTVFAIKFNRVSSYHGCQRLFMRGFQFQSNLQQWYTRELKASGTLSLDSAEPIASTVL